MNARGTPVVLLVAALSAAGLAGCDNSGAPPQTLPPISTAPGTRRPTATPTNSAEALKQSAEQFVRDYYQEFERAQQASDNSVLKSDYYKDSCQPCDFNLRIIETARRNDQHIEGYEFVLTKVTAIAPSPESVAVDIVFHHKPGRLVARDGSVARTFEATGPIAVALYLTRRDDQWLIYNIRSYGEGKQ